MTFAALFFVFLASLALVACPRQWALLPLLVGAFYMTIAQAIMIGPFHFTVIRLLVAVGVIRVIMRREWPEDLFRNTLDRLMIWWAITAVCVSPFHDIPKATLINHLGLSYNTLGLYFLVRCFCQNISDVKGAILMLAILLVPVAFEMLNEQLTRHNFFSIFGGVPEAPAIRNDRLRSQGPFRHAILAGTVGAVCAPLMIGIWRKHPTMAKVGLAACLVITVTSASSGPLLSLIFSVMAISFWPLRRHLRKLRIIAILTYIVLELTMNAPAYYLLARIDLTGSSTGWHRARIIEAAIEHIDDWWLAGTDYTRHWMPYGVSWSPDHSDITNHYLQMGVIGGLPLMALFILMMIYGFRYVGEALKTRADESFENRFLIWTLGASLFAHAATCISVSYFDQSVFFLFLDLAMVASLRKPSEAVRQKRIKARP